MNAETQPVRAMNLTPEGAADGGTPHSLYGLIKEQTAQLHRLESEEVAPPAPPEEDHP